MRLKLTALASATILSLSLTGCGGGDDQKAADNIAKELSANDSTMTVTKDEAQCIGDGMVDKLGVDKLKEYKLLNDDLTTTGNSGSADFTMPKDDAEKTADVFVGCADLKRVMLKQMGAADISEEVTTCIDDALDDKTMKAFLAAMFQKDQETADQVMAPVMECAASAG